jgi:hypothetical protein
MLAQGKHLRLRCLQFDPAGFFRDQIWHILGRNLYTH